MVVVVVGGGRAVGQFGSVWTDILRHGGICSAQVHRVRGKRMWTAWRRRFGADITEAISSPPLGSCSGEFLRPPCSSPDSVSDTSTRVDWLSLLTERRCGQRWIRKLRSRRCASRGHSPGAFSPPWMLHIEDPPSGRSHDVHSARASNTARSTEQEAHGSSSRAPPSVEPHEHVFNIPPSSSAARVSLHSPLSFSLECCAFC